MLSQFALRQKSAQQLPCLAVLYPLLHTFRMFEQRLSLVKRHFFVHFTARKMTGRASVL